MKCSHASIGCGLVILHIIFAPFTTRVLSSISFRFQNALAAYSSDLTPKMTNPDNARKDLCIASRAFEQYLKSQDISLSIVLLPSRNALYQKAIGQNRFFPRSGKSPNTHIANDTAAALKDIGIPTIVLHDKLQNIAKETDLFRDSIHLTSEGLIAVAKEIKTYTTHDTLIVGDCTAQEVAKALDLPRFLWRNGRSNLAPQIIARSPHTHLTLTKHVIWLLSDQYLDPNSKPEFPFVWIHPDKLATTEPGKRTIIANLEKITHIESGFATRAEYPDATVTHTFTGDDGESFLGTIYIMRNRSELGDIRQWQFVGKTLQLTLQPWPEAIKINPDLERDFSFDSTKRYDLPRYFIEEWAHLNQSE